MKQLLRSRQVVIASVAVAVLALGGATAARGSHAGTSVLLLSERSHASPAAPRQAPAADEDQDEAVENEIEQDEDEIAPQPTAPAPAPAPTVSSRTFALVGGTATFTCTGNAISLDSAVPNAGFGVETEREDGGTEIKVRFENDAHRSEIRAACIGGQVTAEEIREESH